MKRLHNLACPSCGGTLAGLGRARIVACRYCGARHLLLMERYIARYALPAVTKRQAVESLKGMLRHPELPKNFTLSVKARETTLYYVPVWEFYGRRLGTRTMIEREFTPDGRRAMQKDTEVHLGDFSRYLPAVHLDHWGLEQTTLMSGGKLPEAPLEAFDEAALAARATVLSPEISTEEIAERFTSLDALSALTLDNQVEIVEARFSLIYYPVWVFRYEHMGKIYGVYIDGMNGAVLRGRAPRREERRVAALLAIAGALALPVAKFFRMGASLIRGPEDIAALFSTSLGLMTLIVSLVFGGAFVLGTLAVGWNMFRFSQEFTFFPGGPSVHYIGKPSQTWAEKWLDELSRTIEKMFEDALRKKNAPAAEFTWRVSFRPWSRK